MDDLTVQKVLLLITDRPEANIQIPQFNLRRIKFFLYKISIIKIVLVYQQCTGAVALPSAKLIKTDFSGLCASSNIILKADLISAGNLGRKIEGSIGIL